MTRATCSSKPLIASDAEHVLIIRLDEIGDVLMTSPMLRELRRNLPDAEISVIVKPGVRNLIALCPYIDEVLTYDWRAPRLVRPFVRHWRALRLARRHLWKRDIDLAINPRWGVDSYYATPLMRLSRADTRVGYSERVTPAKQRHNRGHDGMLTHVITDSTVKHEVEHNLEVIRFLGGDVRDDRLEVWVSQKDEQSAARLLEKKHVSGESLLVALSPGARDAKRRWPLADFESLGRWLRDEHGATLLVVGGPAERPLGQHLIRGLRTDVINTAGRTTLRQAAALLKRCDLFVGNDTGLMHLASAAHVPVVEISCHPTTGSPLAANAPQRFGPWKVPSVVLQPRVAQPPCVEGCRADRPHCIRQVTVAQVKDAAETLLTRSGEQEPTP